MPDDTLFSAAYRCLMATDPAEKNRLSRETAHAWQTLPMDAAEPPLDVPVPGRPAKPELVPPREVPWRNPATLEGRAALLHALAHIEFNAINLAWDAVYRFRGLPADFYRDWIRVAGEEVYHFELLTTHLQSCGYAYGDFPAHNSLWETALETAYDVLARMALVPRFLEARGLDVTPGIMDKLRHAGDQRAVEILEIIFRDEIGHVAAGTRWFNHVCHQRGLAPAAEFQRLLAKHLRTAIKPPFHEAARKQAGFSDEELAFLRTSVRPKPSG